MNDYEFIIRNTIKSLVALVLFMAVLTISSTTTTSAEFGGVSSNGRGKSSRRSTKTEAGALPALLGLQVLRRHDMLHHALLFRHRLPASREALRGLRLCSKDLQLCQLYK
ncbi:PREDICTED: uncharacterized protein LOC101293014 isoform 2 [Fragaria vesca subsp. vesca]